MTLERFTSQSLLEHWLQNKTLSYRVCFSARGNKKLSPCFSFSINGKQLNIVTGFDRLIAKCSKPKYPWVLLLAALPPTVVKHARTFKVQTASSFWAELRLWSSPTLDGLHILRNIFHVIVLLNKSLMHFWGFVTLALKMTSPQALSIYDLLNDLHVKR